jgi:non-homologous end joining protein Ku
VVISDDELKEAAPEKSAAIEIQEFVNESQIPTLYFEKPSCCATAKASAY